MVCFKTYILKKYIKCLHLKANNLHKFGKDNNIILKKTMALLIHHLGFIKTYKFKLNYKVWNSLKNNKNVSKFNTYS